MAANREWHFVYKRGRKWVMDFVTDEDLADEGYQTGIEGARKYADDELGDWRGPYLSKAAAMAARDSLNNGGEDGADAHELTDQRIDALRQMFSQEYEQAAREMRQKLDTFMSDYDKENEKWRQRVQAGKATEAEYKDWRKMQAMNQSWMEGMVSELSADAARVDELVMAHINDEIPQVFANNANAAAYGIESHIGRDTHSFDLYDRDTVRRLITEDTSLLPPMPEPKLNKRKDTAWNARKMRSAITQSVLQGESVPHTAERLMQVFKMDEAVATRTARTALTGAENAGRVHSYERAKSIGINLEQEWMATLDQRTRHSHRQLDGQHVPVGKPFKVDGIEINFPADPTAPAEYVYNCRCTLVAWFPDIEQEDNERWSKLPKGMTYDEWKNGRLAQGNAQQRPQGANIEELREKVRSLEVEVDDLARNANMYYPSENDVRNAQREADAARQRMEEHQWAADIDYDAERQNNRRLYDQYDEMMELQRRRRRLDWDDPERDRITEKYQAWVAAREESDRRLYGAQDYRSAKAAYEEKLQRLERIKREREEGIAEHNRRKTMLNDAVARRNRAYGELSAAQPFAPDVRAKVGDSFADEMERLINAAESNHPEIAGLYKRFSCKFKVVDSHLAQGAFYRSSDKGIHFNAENDRLGDHLSTPYETVFHELGHLIDNISAYRYEFTGNLNGLDDAIKRDWRHFRDSEGRRMGIRRDKNRAVTSMLRGEQRAMGENGLRVFGNVSDIIEGCTRESYPLGAGHGASYHRNTGATGREFFAEVCDSAMSNEESYQQMKRIFPEAVALVEDLARGLLA